jgi:hypothetical protein
LDLAVYNPSLDWKIELFFTNFDDMRDSISPLGFGHAACVGIFTELAVRIGADQPVLNFHAASLKE